MALDSSDRTCVTADLNSARRSSGMFPISVRAVSEIIRRKLLRWSMARASITPAGVDKELRRSSLAFDRLSDDMYRAKVARNRVAALFGNYQQTPRCTAECS